MSKRVTILNKKIIDYKYSDTIQTHYIVLENGEVLYLDDTKNKESDKVLNSIKTEEC